MTTSAHIHLLKCFIMKTVLLSPLFDPIPLLCRATAHSSSQRHAFPTDITAIPAYSHPETKCFISAIKEGTVLRLVHWVYHLETLDWRWEQRAQGSPISALFVASYGCLFYPFLPIVYIFSSTLLKKASP